MTKAPHTPRVGADLIDWLRHHYPRQCIQVGQTEVQAHRYAAKVELAERLIKLGLGDEDHDVLEVDTP